MNAVSVLPSGRLVAIGNSRAWTSDDQGKTWRVHVDVFPGSWPAFALTRAGEAVAMGADVETGEGAVWISTDGISWKRTPAKELNNSRVTAIAAVRASIYVAVETTTGNAESVHSLYAWASGQGFRGVAVETPGGLTESSNAINGMAMLPNGQLIAVGSTIRPEQQAVRNAVIWIDD